MKIYDEVVREHPKIFKLLLQEMMKDTYRRVSDILKLANYYQSTQDNYKYRNYQIKYYNWIDNGQLNRCVNRIKNLNDEFKNGFIDKFSSTEGFSQLNGNNIALPVRNKNLNWDAYLNKNNLDSIPRTICNMLSLDSKPYPDMITVSNPGSVTDVSAMFVAKTTIVFIILQHIL